MNAGDTFRHRDSRPGADARRHLWVIWVILSETSLYPDEVLLAFITTLKPRMDQTCILEADDHPFLNRKSTVAYSASTVVTLAELQAWISAGEIEVLAPLTPTTIERIRYLALSSPRFEPAYQRIAERQHFR